MRRGSSDREGWIHARAGLVGASVIALMTMSACVSQSAEVAHVAGGGDDADATTATEVRLDGRVLNLAVGGGAVYLIASLDRERSLIAVDGDTVTHVDVGDIGGPTHVAAGPDGTAYVGNNDEIFRVDGTGLEPVAEASAEGDISGIAVGSEGEPVWSESFLGVGPDGDDMLMARIQRLAEDSVERIAGVDESPVAAGEVIEWAVTPPGDVPASEFPLRTAGPVAADTDGSVYMSGGSDSILRFGPDGTVEVVTGPGDRVVPDKPYADEGEAADFGGAWSHADLDVDDGRVVAVDRSREHEPTDVESFAWIGDMSDGASDLADVIVRTPSADGSFNLDRNQTQLEQLAVVIDEESASTVAAHVASVAIDDDMLYLAGHTRERADTGDDDAEILIVSSNAQDR